MKLWMKLLLVLVMVSGVMGCQEMLRGASEPLPRGMGEAPGDLPS
jgi:hypothetical protein